MLRARSSSCFDISRLTRSQTSIKLLLFLPQQLTRDQRRIISMALLHASAKHGLISITGLDETPTEPKLFTGKVKGQSAGLTLHRVAINVIAFQIGQDRSERGAIKQLNEPCSVFRLHDFIRDQERNWCRANCCNKHDHMTSIWE